MMHGFGGEGGLAAEGALAGVGIAIKEREVGTADIDVKLMPLGDGGGAGWQCGAN